MDAEALSEVVKAAMNNLRGYSRREEGVKQEIIERILVTLGWDQHNTTQVCREYRYRVGARPVDYALLHFDKPQVLIEAKWIGLAESGRQQLFDYARDAGAPILVLTDGLKWEFYYSWGSGTWEERRFHQFALNDDSSLPSSAEFLARHLGREAVETKQAHRSAEDRLTTIQGLESAKKALPEIWRELLTEPHHLLHDLLRERVQAKCGSEPRSDDIDSFLERFANADHLQTRGPIEDPTTHLPDSESDSGTGAPRPSTKLPRPSYRDATLQALIKLGGRGPRTQVLEQVFEMIEPYLEHKDIEANNQGRIRWQHSVDGAVASMRQPQSGLLKPDAGNGLWEISDLGRKRLSEQQ